MKVVVIAAKAAAVTGYALLLGSIASFIAMSVGGGDEPGIQFSYWQRSFVHFIMNGVTIPGVWLFLAGNAGLLLSSVRRYWPRLVIAALVFINGLFIITPMARVVNHLAARQQETSAIISEYAVKKSTEDTLGGINLLLLGLYLIVYLVQAYKKNDAKTGNDKAC